MARNSKSNQPESPTLFDQAPANAEQTQEGESGASTGSGRAGLLGDGGPKRLLLMDGHAMVFRAWFALAQQRPLTIRKTGEDIRGVYSFTSTFFKVLADQKPTHVAIVFDPPGPTFRDEQYAAYKAHRPAAPPELQQNIERVKQVMRAFNVPIHETPGYEADDVLGAIAQGAAAQGIDTVIATGDTDTLQLVSPQVRVLLTTGFSDQKLYDVTAVRQRYDGLEPAQQRDVKALTGDTSDNIPGVPGVGVKTAVKLIQEFGSVEALLDRLDEVKPPRIQGLLREHADTIRQGKRLVTIDCDAPHDFDLGRAEFGHFRREDVLEVFRELEFSSMLGRIPPSLDEKASTSSTQSTSPTVYAPSIATADATEVTIVDTPEALEAMVDRLKAAGEFTFDTETTSTRAMDCDLVGLSFAVEEGKAWYVPLGHKAGPHPSLPPEGEGTKPREEGTQPQGKRVRQLPLEEVMGAVRPLLEDDSVAKIGHNLNFDITTLFACGVRPTKVKVGFDTMIAAHLLGEKALGLKQLAFTRLNTEMTPITDLIGTGRKQVTFDQVPIEDAARYAAADADMTLRLKNVLAADLERDGLTKLNTEYEMPLVNVLVQMQVNGIALDTGVLAELNEEITSQIQESEAAAYDAVGHRFNINSPSQLGDLLFKELKLPSGRRTQTGYSTDAAILEGLRDAHPVVDHVLRYRALTKLKSTYVDTLPLQVNPRTGRIHTSYNQAGSATGRVASNDPNLQNIPVRTELGLRVRKAFVAEERPDWTLLSADYSQIDLRALAHLSGDPALIEAFENDQDIHASTASLIYKVPLNEVTRDMRRLAKVMNFGVVYGLSAFGIAQQTELTVEEGNAFISTYMGTYPRVKEYLEETIANAKRDGYVETLLGRRRYVPELNSPRYPVRQAAERMAVNMPVQGTSADIIKVAMVQVQKRLEDDGMRSKMLLQVHDELVFETPKEEEEALSSMLREVMPNALALNVPLKIDIKTGYTWGDMEVSEDATPGEILV